MIKAFVPALVIASALAAPTFAFAQSQDSNAPVTRAEVRADLVRLEKAGYNPSTDRVDYPKNIQAAEARVHAQGDSGYGPSVAGTSASGSARSNVSMSNPDSVYFGH
jgi:hypothetical protein